MRFVRVAMAAFVLSLLLVTSLRWSGPGFLHTQAAGLSSSGIALHETRSSPLDLEVSGGLAGVPAGTVRFVRREDLLKLPQVSFRVSNDDNLAGPTQISGVLLEELLRQVSTEPPADMVVAICDDLYRANYPRAYLTAHHPVLALRIDGKEPKDWPKDSEGNGLDIGPYLISHDAFAPSYAVLTHPEKAQIPWGVVRLEFRNEETVFGGIQPRGIHGKDQGVQDGYRLAQQNCFRCHNMGAEGGEKAGHPWLVLAAWAASAPDYFTAYVRNPRSRNTHAQMPGNPDYDDATMHALIAYFSGFVTEAKP
jgi:mono/diheme cytochrome c family protein